ncbi:MAG: HupE/UreJ family protein [Acidimicrobiales bacterium]
MFLLLALPGVADAHTGNQSYLYLDVTEKSVSGRAELPIVDLRVALGLGLEGSDEQVLAELEANYDRLRAYAEEHLEIGPVGQKWPIDFGAVELFYSDAPEVDDNYIILPFDVVVGNDSVPRQFDLRFDFFFEAVDGRDALLLIGNDWQGGVIENGREDLATFDEQSPVQTIDLGDPSVFKNFTASGKLGMNHIKTGPDHILFVLVLLLPSVLVFREKWQPTDRFASALWRVLKVVTMFTVAHSITFTLAGIGLLPLPSPRIVESIIALSIAAAALHNIRPIAANREWMISFAFGLFHGMGFASLVSGLDVSRGTQLVSLFGRNVGIEIGQAIVVLLLFPALFLLRRTRVYRPFFVGVSLLLTFVALIWMIERLFETDLGINTFVDPVFVWPRVVFYIAALTAASAAFFVYERSAGRLLETAERHVPESLELEKVATP